MEKQLQESSDGGAALEHEEGMEDEAATATIDETEDMRPLAQTRTRRPVAPTLTPQRAPRRPRRVQRPYVERGTGHYGGRLALLVQVGERTVTRTVDGKYDWQDKAYPARRETRWNWDPGVT